VAPRLRDFAKLDKRVSLAGVGNKFEIWNEEAWEKNGGDWVAGPDGDADLPNALESLTL
jgi:MraZ protein